MKSKKPKKYSSQKLDLERRRIRAIQQILDGIKAVDVAKELNVTKSAVSQWLRSYRESGWEGLKAKPKPGAPIIFTPEHSQKLFEIISKSPYAWGFESDLWTVRMSRDVLFEQTGSYFSETRIL
jgi:transposase